MLKNCVFCYFILHFTVKTDNVMDVASQIVTFYEKLYIDPGHRRDEVTGCLLYKGSVRQTDGYCHITYLNGNNWTSMSAHRAALMVEKRGKLPKLQASHLCHEKTCINPEHLNLESAAINNRRKICANENRCTGHPGYPDCILRN